MTKDLLKSILVATALTLPTIAFAGGNQDQKTQNKGQVNAGILKCVSAGGTSFIVGETKDLSCTFDSISGTSDDKYTGTVKKYGLSLGATGKTVIIWTVLASTVDLKPGALEGEYAGVAADASLVAGGGAKFLVGGSRKSISLQPLSVQSQTGLNIAAGIVSLDLKAKKKSANAPS